MREDEGQHSGRSKQSRTAQFLVIYASRRGLLEVQCTVNQKYFILRNVCILSIAVGGGAVVYMLSFNPGLTCLISCSTILFE